MLTSYEVNFCDGYADQTVSSINWRAVHLNVDLWHSVNVKFIYFNTYDRISLAVSHSCCRNVSQCAVRVCQDSKCSGESHFTAVFHCWADHITHCVLSIRLHCWLAPGRTSVMLRHYVPCSGRPARCSKCRKWFKLLVCMCGVWYQLSSAPWKHSFSGLPTVASSSDQTNLDNVMRRRSSGRRRTKSTVDLICQL